MITLQKAIEIGNYKITSGEKYLWKCYGPNARFIGFEHNENSSYEVIFDTETHTVYEMTVCDYNKDNCYRIIHPDYYDAHLDESESRNISHNEAYDGVKFIDLEIEDDFIEKATAIIAENEYDERVSVELELDETTLFYAMTNAHNMDMTLNQYIEHIIKKCLKNEDISEKN